MKRWLERTLKRASGSDEILAEVRRVAGLRDDVRELSAELKHLTKIVVAHRRLLDRLSARTLEMRGVLTHQNEFTVEALHRAGWMSDQDAVEQRTLSRALQAIEPGRPVIIGPWTGEVGFELLYWIPFLTWLKGRGLDSTRTVAVSRGGTAAWYGNVASRYVDVLELFSPEEFRERTSEGSRKQRGVGDFDQDILQRVQQREGLKDARILHPRLMYRLFQSFWRQRATTELIEGFTVFEHLLAPAGPPPSLDLPDGYVAARFYFNKSFRDNTTNRAFIDRLLATVLSKVPVVLMSPGVQVDDHAQYDAKSKSGLVVIDPHRQPEKNLELQTQIIRGARGLIGTYGGFSYLAPFYGVRSLSFFSDRGGFEPHHLELAQRVFDRLAPGYFSALSVSELEMLTPSIEQWVGPLTSMAARETA